MSKMEIGDIVLLKDGTRMTVRSIKNETVTCDWFDLKNQLQQRAFDESELIIKD
jgi:uncharacterized protein YodC (DUF2158 family)